MLFGPIFFYAVTYLPPICFMWQWFRIEFPEQAQQITERIAWFALKAETYAHRFFDVLWDRINDYIFLRLNNFLYSSVEQDNIIFIKDGNEIKHMTHTNFLNETDFPEFDFILHNVDNNMIRYNDIETFKSQENNVEINQSNIKFLEISFEVIATDYKNKFEIIFGDDNFNIVNNILFDKPFIVWYLKKYLNIDANSLDNFTFLVSFIDSNITCLTLSDNEAVKLIKNGYELL